ncbi:MAG TPA: DDE-type integrase/transposase/recombinase, partial [Oculatellaceae cyanobacterium]
MTDLNPIRRDGELVNPKRVYRIYCEENLKVRIRRRKRLAVARGQMTIPSGPNIRWSMDFTSDTLYSGRRYRTLNVVDDFSRDSLGIDVAFSIPSGRVTRFLDRLIWVYGKPEKITCDNG